MGKADASGQRAGAALAGLHRLSGPSLSSSNHTASYVYIHVMLAHSSFLLSFARLSRSLRVISSLPRPYLDCLLKQVSLGEPLPVAAGQEGSAPGRARGEGEEQGCIPGSAQLPLPRCHEPSCSVLQAWQRPYHEACTPAPWPLCRPPERRQRLPGRGRVKHHKGAARIGPAVVPIQAGIGEALQVAAQKAVGLVRHICGRAGDGADVQRPLAPRNEDGRPLGLQDVPEFSLL